MVESVEILAHSCRRPVSEIISDIENHMKMTITFDVPPQIVKALLEDENLDGPPSEGRTVMEARVRERITKIASDAVTIAAIEKRR